MKRLLTFCIYSILFVNLFSQLSVTRETSFGKIDDGSKIWGYPLGTVQVTARDDVIIISAATIAGDVKVYSDYDNFTTPDPLVFNTAELMADELAFIFSLDTAADAIPAAAAATATTISVSRETAFVKIDFGDGEIKNYPFGVLKASVQSGLILIDNVHIQGDVQHRGALSTFASPDPAVYATNEDMIDQLNKMFSLDTTGIIGGGGGGAAGDSSWVISQHDTLDNFNNTDIVIHAGITADIITDTWNMGIADRYLYLDGSNRLSGITFSKGMILTSDGTGQATNPVSGTDYRPLIENSAKADGLEFGDRVDVDQINVDWQVTADTLLIKDESGADSALIFDDGDTTRFESDNPIKIGDGSLIIDNTGKAWADDLEVSEVATIDTLGSNDSWITVNTSLVSPSGIIQAVTGNVQAGANVIAGGTVQGANGTFTDDLSVNDTLTVQNKAFINDDLRVTDSLLVNGNVFVGTGLKVDNVSSNAGSTINLNTQVAITDDLSVGDTLFLTGASTDGIKFADGSYQSTAPGNTRAYMAFADSSETLTMTQNNWSHVTNGTNTLFTAYLDNNITVQGDSAQLTTGVYEIHYSMSYTGANSDVYHTSLFADNAEIANRFHCDRGMSGSDAGTVMSVGLYEVTDSDDWIKLMIENTANNNDATILSASISFIKIQ